MCFVCNFCALIRCYCTNCLHKMYKTNKSTVLLCKCSWCRANTIDQRCTSYNFKKKHYSIESWFISYEERYTYYKSKKAITSICHRTTFYSIFNMSSYRTPEIQNDLPEVTQIKWMCYFLNKQWSKVHNYVYCIMF